MSWSKTLALLERQPVGTMMIGATGRPWIKTGRNEWTLFSRGVRISGLNQYKEKDMASGLEAFARQGHDWWLY